MKTMFKLLTIMWLLTINHHVMAQEPEWFKKLKQLKPLFTSKSDVENLFGNLKVKKQFIDKGIESVFYEAPEDAFLSLKYSAGDCSTGKSYDYQTNKGNIIEAIYFLNKRSVNISKFLINKNEFETRKDDDDTLYYFNKELGIEFGTQRDEVIHVEFFPSSKYDYLKCERVSKP
jgi:hypothetical protein